MTEKELSIMRKFMKKLSSEVRTCIHKSIVISRAETLEEVLFYAEKCIEDKRDSGGMSESDFRKRTSELENFIEDVKEEMDKLKDFLKDRMKEMTKSKKKDKKNNNNQPDKR